LALATREARNLDPKPSPEKAARTSNAERQRRFRERKKGRVVKHVRVSVHDGDLDLLRQLGFLMADENDDAAIADALEAFLLNSFLGPALGGPSWRARMAAQRARLLLLRGGKS
jgi:hypothetical protein